ncbi:MAG: hypothetical protein LBT47_06105 [Deltaproteobacteria bacterium]|jgi:hypothetical protein|nr:hypothetical protein [Deltaproteobacteria bacterium]
MSNIDPFKNNIKKESKEEPVDNVEYFKKIRNDVLVKLGLPANTKPDKVKMLLEIKLELEKIKNKNSH